MARAIANVNLMNSQVTLRQTRIDLLAHVKTAYYSALVAQQNVTISTALVWFTNEAYRIQVNKFRAGEASAYEPAQLRTLSVQAKASLVQAQNRYISAWKQLAAVIGVPDLPTSRLEGSADAPMPPIDYDRMLGADSQQSS